jgi:hypothetical protein
MRHWTTSFQLLNRDSHYAALRRAPQMARVSLWNRRSRAHCDCPITPLGSRLSLSDMTQPAALEPLTHYPLVMFVITLAAMWLSWLGGLWLRDR